MSKNDSQLLQELPSAIRKSFAGREAIPKPLLEWIGRIAPTFEYAYTTKQFAESKGYRSMTYAFTKKEYIMMEKVLGDISEQNWILVKNKYGLEIWVK
ncbi:MAG: hypothetical protein CMM02_05285 [Rhodopirellula sp.]|jgi:hypothetical protein|nr:hypothetical protein [Rhodopirellula sp.]|tara:strand:- start:6134 stop:6427 length:294 start_codon:yes stop_codon:yes gene_type:complete